MVLIISFMYPKQYQIGRIFLAMKTTWERWSSEATFSLTIIIFSELYVAGALSFSRKGSLLQAESAIAALNCSGVVLGSLPIRSPPPTFHEFLLGFGLYERATASTNSSILFRVSPSKTPVRPRAPRPSMHWNPCWLMRLGSCLSTHVFKGTGFGGSTLFLLLYWVPCVISTEWDVGSILLASCSGWNPEALGPPSISFIYGKTSVHLKPGSLLHFLIWRQELDGFVASLPPPLFFIFFLPFFSFACYGVCLGSTWDPSFPFFSFFFFCMHVGEELITLCFFFFFGFRVGFFLFSI